MKYALIFQHLYLLLIVSLVRFILRLLYTFLVIFYLGLCLIDALVVCRFYWGLLGLGFCLWIRLGLLRGCVYDLSRLRICLGSFLLRGCRICHLLLCLLNFCWNIVVVEISLRLMDCLIFSTFIVLFFKYFLLFMVSGSHLSLQNQLLWMQEYQYN